MDGTNRVLLSSHNDVIDDTFVKLNLYYITTENKLLKNLMLKNMRELSLEIIKRDGTKSEMFHSFFRNLEMT